MHLLKPPLTYSSGARNSVIGLGWRLSLPDRPQAAPPTTYALHSLSLSLAPGRRASGPTRPSILDGERLNQGRRTLGRRQVRAPKEGLV